MKVTREHTIRIVQSLRQSLCLRFSPGLRDLGTAEQHDQAQRLQLVLGDLAPCGESVRGSATPMVELILWPGIHNQRLCTLQGSFHVSRSGAGGCAPAVTYNSQEASGDRSCTFCFLPCFPLGAEVEGSANTREAATYRSNLKESLSSCQPGSASDQHHQSCTLKPSESGCHLSGLVLCRPLDLIKQGLLQGCGNLGRAVDKPLADQQPCSTGPPGLHITSGAAAASKNGRKIRFMRSGFSEAPGGLHLFTCCKAALVSLLVQCCIR